MLELHGETRSVVASEIHRCSKHLCSMKRQGAARMPRGVTRNLLHVRRLSRVAKNGPHRTLTPCDFVATNRRQNCGAFFLMVLMVKDARPKPSDLAAMTDQERVELFKTMVAYAGTYAVEPSTVTHHLDISWNQIFTGADQVRNIEFDGCKFIMSTNPQPRSQEGEVAVSVLRWERLS